MKNIYMYVQDTITDWEHGYLMHALSLQAMLGEPKVKILKVSKGKKSIKIHWSKIYKGEKWW